MSQAGPSSGAQANSATPPARSRATANSPYRRRMFGMAAGAALVVGSFAAGAVALTDSDTAPEHSDALGQASSTSTSPPPAAANPQPVNPQPAAPQPAPAQQTNPAAAPAAPAADAPAARPAVPPGGGAAPPAADQSPQPPARQAPTPPATPAPPAPAPGPLAPVTEPLQQTTEAVVGGVGGLLRPALTMIDPLGDLLGG